MDWHEHFKKVFFETWRKAGLPFHEDFVGEYIEMREHNDFKTDWINESRKIPPSLEWRQLLSVYGFGVVTGKIFGEMLRISAVITNATADWCGRFNLGISLFDYICDELAGTNNVTSLKVFQPFIKTKHTATRLLSPAEELLSELAGSILSDVEKASVNKKGSYKTSILFKVIRQMFEAEVFISQTTLSAEADLHKIKKALFLKSAAPFRLMAELTARMADANDRAMIQNARAIGKALGYCYWLIDDSKDLHEDLKAGRWNLFFRLAAMEEPQIFAQHQETLTIQHLENIWKHSRHAEKFSNEIIARLVKATMRLKLSENTKHHTLGLVSASLWQWYNY